MFQPVPTELQLYSSIEIRLLLLLAVFMMLKQITFKVAMIKEDN